MDPQTDLANLLTFIERTERIAIAKAMCGQWTAHDDDYLEELYRLRREMMLHS